MFKILLYSENKTHTSSWRTVIHDSGKQLTKVQSLVTMAVGAIGFAGIVMAGLPTTPALIAIGSALGTAAAAAKGTDSLAKSLTPVKYQQLMGKIK